MSPEVQGYVRHALHSVGLLLVVYGGLSPDMLEVYVGIIVSVGSFAWFAYAKHKEHKQLKAAQAAAEVDTGCSKSCCTEHCECDVNKKGA
jgi:hypothetical protein